MFKDTLIVPQIMPPKRKQLKAAAPSTRTTRSRAKSVEDQATLPPQDLAQVAVEPIAEEEAQVAAEPEEEQVELPPPDLPIAEENQDQDLAVAGPSKHTVVSKTLDDQTIS
jgi:hypothetical protein